MKSINRTRSRRFASLLAIVGLLVAAPAAGAASGKYGEPDGWTSRALEGTTLTYSAPDGWMTRALQGPGYGEPDGWIARALEGPSEDAARVMLGRTQSLYGHSDGWMSRALDSANYGARDGWMTRALEPTGNAGLSVPREDLIRLTLNESQLSGAAVRPSLESSSSGFDYGDAVIGGAATLSALLMLGVAFGVKRSARRQLAGS